MKLELEIELDRENIQNKKMLLYVRWEQIVNFYIFALFRNLIFNF